jgi:hypothetical protein
VPTVSPSGRSGSVSAPLTLTAPNDLNPVLTLVAAAGTIADGNAIFVVNDEHGLAELYLDPDFFRLVSGVGAGPMTLVVQQTDVGGTSVSVASDIGVNVRGGSVRINNAGLHQAVGFVADGPIVDPASGIPTPGFTFWLDPTPGATLLKIKAKDSGGTVRTATVPLT